MRILVLFVLLCGAWAAIAKGTYQEPASFLEEVFAGSPPNPSVMWIAETLKPEIRAILGHDLPRQRVRYWSDDRRTVWILEEIGKERPITTGLVVNDGKLEQLRVLVFRESRGWEVRHAFFTDQFRGVGAGRNGHLDRSIDSISGATLSVRALNKLARLALLFDRQVRR